MNGDLFSQQSQHKLLVIHRVWKKEATVFLCIYFTNANTVL